MSSFFDVSQQHSESLPLNLADAAHKIIIASPKRARKPRGSWPYFILFNLMALGAMSCIVGLTSLGVKYGLVQMAIYLTGGAALTLFCALLFTPTWIWYSKDGIVMFLNYAFGLIALCLFLTLQFQDVKYPDWMWKVNYTTSIVQKYSFTLPTDKEIDFLTRVVYGEARGEKPENQANIVQTIINRASNPKRRYGQTFQDILLTPNAYSCLDPKDPNYVKLLELKTNNLTYQKIHAIVVNTIVARMNGATDPTHGSTHYHTAEVDPHWNRNAVSMIKLGNHQFWTGVDD